MYTILIVDDEANLLEVLAVALENMGYGTVTAETAEEALAVLCLLYTSRAAYTSTLAARRPLRTPSSSCATPAAARAS